MEENKKHPIKSIVLSGGGTVFCTQLGIIQTLERSKFWSIENIETIYATSAGTWLSIILCCRLNWDIINGYIIDRPWDEVLNLTPENLMNMYSSKGIFSVDALRVFFAPIMKACDLTLDITMKEFYEYSKIELNFYTFELNAFEIVQLSYLSHPNLKLIDAIYMSSSLPLLFNPICTIDKKCYIDGGLVANYPLEYCLKRGYLEEEILSFRNNYTNIGEVLVEEETSSTSFLFIFINKLVDLIDTEKKQIKINNEILCDTKTTSIEDIIAFVNSKNIRLEILNNGINIGKSFLDKLN